MNRIDEIHQQALMIAKRYKTSEIELIEILQLAGEHRVFYYFKYNSLFQYAVRALGLSEEVAYIYINVSRKAAQVPKLKDEIHSGRISVSKAKTIAAVLTNENQNYWLELAVAKSKRQVERAVALASPVHAVRERSQYTVGPVAESASVLSTPEVFVELTIGVPEKLMLKLRQAQDLVSQSKREHVSLVEALEAMADFFILRKDPLEAAKRQKMRGKLDADVNLLVPGPANVDAASLSRTPLTAAVKHQVYLSHQGMCSYRDESGNRCSSRRMLEIHHIVPVSEGGDNGLENLTLLCQGHHRGEHLGG
jgi:hypothetical protein